MCTMIWFWKKKKKKGSSKSTTNRTCRRWFRCFWLTWSSSSARRNRRLCRSRSKPDRRARRPEPAKSWSPLWERRARNWSRSSYSSIRCSARNRTAAAATTRCRRRPSTGVWPARSPPNSARCSYPSSILSSVEKYRWTFHSFSSIHFFFNYYFLFNLHIIVNYYYYSIFF